MHGVTSQPQEPQIAITFGIALWILAGMSSRYRKPFRYPVRLHHSVISSIISSLGLHIKQDGFADVLRDFTREVLREQPRAGGAGVGGAASQFFRTFSRLLALRREGDY